MLKAKNELTPSRRGLLSLAGLLPLVALPSLPAIPGRAAIDDPLLHLHRQYLATQAAEALACDEAETIRNRLIARWGQATSDRSASDIWGHDPDYDALGGAVTACDELTQQVSDITDLMVETPATTPAGVAAKLLIAIDVFPEPDHRTEYHERIALAVMMNAVAVLPSAGEGRI